MNKVFDYSNLSQKELIVILSNKQNELREILKKVEEQKNELRTIRKYLKISDNIEDREENIEAEINSLNKVLLDILSFAEKNRKLLGVFELDYPPFSIFKESSLELETLAILAKQERYDEKIAAKFLELKKSLIHTLKTDFDQHNLGPKQKELINGVYKKLCLELNISIIEVHQNDRFDEESMLKTGGHPGSSRYNEMQVAEVLAYGLRQKNGQILQKSKVVAYRSDLSL